MVQENKRKKLNELVKKEWVSEGNNGEDFEKQCI